MYIKNVCIIFDASLWEAEKYFQHLFLNTVSKNLISTAIQWTKTCGPWVMVNCNSNFLANKSTRCTILLSFFYFSSLHVSENYVPIIGRNYCYLCDTGICHTEWQTPVSHRYNSFSWWWAHGCLKHIEKRNKYTKQNCAPSWIYLRDCTRMHGQENIKFCNSSMERVACCHVKYSERSVSNLSNKIRMTYFHCKNT